MFKNSTNVKPSKTFSNTNSTPLQQLSSSPTNFQEDHTPETLTHTHTLSHAFADKILQAGGIPLYLVSWAPNPPTRTFTVVVGRHKTMKISTCADDDDDDHVESPPCSRWNLMAGKKFTTHSTRDRAEASAHVQSPPPRWPYIKCSGVSHSQNRARIKSNYACARRAGQRMGVEWNNGGRPNVRESWVGRYFSFSRLFRPCVVVLVWRG